MIVLRAIAGIVVGYVVYAFASMLLVGPVSEGGGPGLIVMALIVLALIGGVAGAIVALVAGEKARLAAAICAGLVVLATLANLVLGLGAEPTWYKLGTLLLTAPALFLVGDRISRR